jgi:hypothetical protein
VPNRTGFPATSERKDQFQSDQQEDWSSDPLPQVDAETGRKFQRRDHQGLSGRYDRYLEVTKDGSRTSRLIHRTIEIDEFVAQRTTTLFGPPVYRSTAGFHDAYAVIRETIRRSIRLHLDE